MKLVVGSLNTPPSPDIVRIDIVPQWGDVTCDIRLGIPIYDKIFDIIDCKHILEHIQLTENFVFVMWEMYRLLKSDGRLNIEVPHKDSDAAYECIGHTRFFVLNSFKDFYDNPYAKEMGYPIFKLIKAWEGNRNGHKTVNVILTK